MSKEITYDKVWFPDVGFEVKRHVEYKWNEDVQIRKILEYIDTTYGAHYARGKIQATEVIADSGHANGFTIGNIIKYAMRLGKKDGFNKKDLLKIVHYAIIALELYERENSDRTQG